MDIEDSKVFLTEKEHCCLYSKFTVDRDTGVVYGLGSSHISFEILHRGDEGQSFKALRNNGEDGIQYLKITHYHASPFKPFVYFSSFIRDETLTGTCVTY